MKLASVDVVNKFTFVTLSLGNANAVDHLIGSEDIVDVDGLLEVFLGPLDLILDGPAVELDLHDVRLLLTLLQQLHLGVGDHADDRAVTNNFLEVLFNGLAAEVILPFLARLGKSLLL